MTSGGRPGVEEHSYRSLRQRATAHVFLSFCWLLWLPPEGLLLCGAPEMPKERGEFGERNTLGRRPGDREFSQSDQKGTYT